MRYIAINNKTNEEIKKFKIKQDVEDWIEEKFIEDVVDQRIGDWLWFKDGTEIVIKKIENNKPKFAIYNETMGSWVNRVIYDVGDYQAFSKFGEAERKTWKNFNKVTEICKNLNNNFRRRLKYKVVLIENEFNAKLDLL